MKHWGWIRNREPFHALLIVCVPFLLFFVSLPMAFSPNAEVFRMDTTSLLLVTMIQYASTYRRRAFLTIPFLCDILSTVS